MYPKMDIKLLGYILHKKSCLLQPVFKDTS